MSYKPSPNLLITLKCALADLEGIMPEFDVDGERSHPGWKTINELKLIINELENFEK